MITTNKWGECLIKILKPDMKEPKPFFNQWKEGNNIFHETSNDVYFCFRRFGNFQTALQEYHDKFPKYNFRVLKICLLAIPEESILENTGRIIQSNRATVYKIKTGEELCREDSPLYRIYVSVNAASCLEDDDMCISLYNEFDWTIYSIYCVDSRRLNLVPKEYRKSLYFCIVVQMSHPGNQLFVVKDESIVKTLEQIGSLDNFFDREDYYDMIYGGYDVVSGLTQVWHPNPVVAQRRLISWLVLQYNHKYNTDYCILGIS